MQQLDRMKKNVGPSQQRPKGAGLGGLEQFFS
jgi:hypothetical protein